MEKKRICFIVNLQSGIGQGKKCYLKIRKWLEENENKNIATEFFFTEKYGKRNAANLAKMAVEKKYSLIVAVGGDGTFNEIANGIMGSDIPILVAPAGNGNDFAKSIRIPKETEQVLGLIENGKIKSVDVGMVNERIFVNVFGVGFDTRVARCAENLKRKLPKFLKTPNILLYLIALLWELFIKIEYPHVDIMFYRKRDFIETMPEKITTVIIGNGFGCGGIFKLTPQADICDGLLDVCMIRKMKRWKILWFIPKGIKGTHLKLREVKKENNGMLPRVSSLVISSLEKKKIPCQMDGEIIAADTTYHISVLPEALKVVVP